MAYQNYDFCSRNVCLFSKRCGDLRIFQQIQFCRVHRGCLTCEESEALVSCGENLKNPRYFMYFS